MNLSYWEKKHWLSDINFIIIGSGIVGLSTALFLKRKFPKKNIVIVEKGILPSGGSTKNAGFSCFGSLSEILSDLETHTNTEILNLVNERVIGLNLMRKTLGDVNIDYKKSGGYELFMDKESHIYDKCLENLKIINDLLSPIFKNDVYKIVSTPNCFSKLKPKCFFSPFEAQLDPGKMILSLIKLVQSKGIKLLNNINVKSYQESDNFVQIETDFIDLKCDKIVLTTNGFTNKLNKLEVAPARNQVLVTKPIKNLEINGSFHMDRGYYYFRNIDKRILIGGGRQLDFENESTTKFGTTHLIQNKLEQLLEDIILPNHDFEIENRWSGIMGVGPNKSPIISKLSERVYTGVRMGGMGIAIGFNVGKKLSEIIS
tara:strand:- start:9789 stop:10904 length:1116 start_codon:yes stop_codon:yes gene_type:complete